MFEVGRSYKVTTLEGEDTCYTSADVLEVDGRLVKFSRPGNYIIINTASPTFVSAIPDDERAKREESEEMERFRSSIKINIADGDERL